MTSTIDVLTTSMILPEATCNGASLRTARWIDQADLAMVRDWFYPHKMKTSSRLQAPFDPYNPVIVDEDVDPDLDDDEDAYQNPGSSPFSEPVSSARRKSRSKQKLTSRVIDDKRRAVERVSLYSWHDQRVPHALLATAALVDAKLHYDLGYSYSYSHNITSSNTLQTPRPSADANPNFTISTAAMKSIYAMAFCRFVNGFVDRDVARSSRTMRESGLGSSTSKQTLQTADPDGEVVDDEISEDDSHDDSGDDDDGLNTGYKALPKGAGESSMYKHAQTIGMPLSFVDLRHKATHGKELPGMNELKRATEEALNWLWDKWWKVNVKDNATVRLWETQQWDEAVVAFSKEHATVQSIEPQQRSSSNEIGRDESGRAPAGRWESVTENGVTRFVYVGESTS